MSLSPMKVDLHYLYTAKYAKWIIRSLIALFSLLIIADYASVIFHPVVSDYVPAPVEAVVKPKQDFSKFVLKSSLFGVYVPTGSQTGTVKKSMLNATVVGVLFSDQPEDSQVIIRLAGGDEKTYKSGDSIPGGVKIKRITTNGVLLERNGNLESLSLPKNELQFEPVPKPLKEE